MPKPSGLTVAAPETTWSLIPSFGYGVVASEPKTRGGVRLVLAEERLGRLAVGAGRALEPVAGERVVGDAEGRAVALDPRTVGAALRRPRVPEPERRQHVQRRLVGPWFSISIRASTSVGEAFA